MNKEVETHLITKNGRRYWISAEYELFNDEDKFIGWYKAGIYTPSPAIQVRRNKIEGEAQRRLNEEKFEEAIKRRMTELRKIHRPE